jgi:hypothetical protein
MPATALSGSRQRNAIAIIAPAAKFTKYKECFFVQAAKYTMSAEPKKQAPPAINE